MSDRDTGQEAKSALSRNNFLSDIVDNGDVVQGRHIPDVAWIMATFKKVVGRRHVLGVYFEPSKCEFYGGKKLEPKI